MGSLAKELRRYPRQLYDTWKDGVLDLSTLIRNVMSWQTFTHVSSVTGARVANANGVYLCDASGGAFTLTIAEQDKAHITVVKTDASANVVTVQGVGTINGAASSGLSSQWDGATFICDGTNWIQTNQLGSAVDHGGLTGLGDDDHPQYLKLTGGNLSGPGNLDVDGTLDVTGVTTLDSTLDVSGKATTEGFESHTGTGTVVSTGGNVIGATSKGSSGEPTVSATETTYDSATVIGAAISTGTGTADLTASGVGSLVIGAAEEINGASIIKATNDGSIALGNATNNGEISSDYAGSYASGYASFGAITASGIGSSAQGSALGGDITASNTGSLAIGNTVFRDITCSSLGGIAAGYTLGGDIISSGATNCFQFGPGTNTQANSFQVGTEIRLNGTTTAPGTPQNGDIYVDSDDYVNIYSDDVFWPIGDKVVTVTASGTYTADLETVILCDDDAASGAITVTLPITAHRRFRVKKLGNTANVTIQGASGNIDDAATHVITVQYDSRDCVCDGTNYWMV